jgi:alpha-amylase
VQISTPPCNGTARRRGFSVWGPVGLNFNAALNIAVRTTQQEWEMADDLGDSHPGSLQQGGALPALSKAIRTAGKIYPAAGSLVTYRIFSTNSNAPIKLMLTDFCGRVVDSVVGVGNLTKGYTITTTGWYVVKAQHTSDTVANSNRCWINVTYTAPRVVDARANASRIPLSLDLGIDRAVCSNNAVVNAFIDADCSYNWLLPNGNTSTNSLQSYSNPGVYKLTVTNSRTGCQVTDSVNIIAVNQSPRSTITQSVNNDTLSIIPQTGMTYTWRRGTDTLVIDSITTALPINGNGVYWVTVTSKAGCGISTGSILVTNLKEVLTSSEIEVYPNPNNGSFKLTVPERFEGSKVVITDLQGKAAFIQQLVGNSTEVSQSQTLAAGMYLIRIEHSKGTGVKKLAIQ